MPNRNELHALLESPEFQHYLRTMEEVQPGISQFFSEYVVSVDSLYDIADDINREGIGQDGLYDIIMESSCSDRVVGLLKFLIINTEMTNALSMLDPRLYERISQMSTWYMNMAIQASFWYGYRTASGMSDLPDWD